MELLTVSIFSLVDKVSAVYGIVAIGFIAGKFLLKFGSLIPAHFFEIIKKSSLKGNFRKIFITMSATLCTATAYEPSRVRVSNSQNVNFF